MANNTEHHRLFTKVSAARQVLREKAEQIVNEYLEVVTLAKASGDYMTAAKALQWLIEHLPKDEQGTGAVDRSVDKDSVATIAASKTPDIKIGIQLGGVTAKPKELKGEVIDVKPIK